MSAMKERKGQTGVHSATVQAWGSKQPSMPTIKQFKQQATNIAGSNNRSKERTSGKG